MFTRKTTGAILGIAIIVLSFISPITASAVTSSTSGNGLRVSPVRTDISLSAGQSETISVFVQNVTSSPANLQAIVNDFTADTNESGAPRIYVNNQYAPTNSLKRFVQPIPHFTVGPNASKEIPVTITVPKGTAGGGYYGVVRFAPVSAGGGTVSLSASVGSLILATVQGNIVDNLKIASFDVRSISTDSSGKTHERAGFVFNSTKNLNLVIRLSNQGNVQEQPFGKVQLKDRSGKVLAVYEVNDTQPRGNILPNSIRRFDIPLTKVGSFGKYTVVGNLGYGTKGQLLTATTTFYVIPIGLIFAALVLLLVIILLIVLIPRWLKNHDRKVARRARR